ncbi:MAG: aldehyde dehydrogenase (NADP(+)) [Gammaproteobacteria bacterium]|nr:aldehyde dehydrogenase (NADP(+)) [Gammaproteobacteria bacterium]
MTNHIIAGTSQAPSNRPTTDIELALAQAEAAFESFSQSTIAARAALLNSIADHLIASKAALLDITPVETNLPPARIESELMRTTNQLRYFADHIQSSDCFAWTTDEALPDRQPLPRPRLQMVQRPVGPVVVFGASNFPLAFSVAGGDTASALAAGCPVVVKGHEAHPETGRIAATAITDALRQHNMHPGIFSMIQGGGVQTGQALVDHPNTAAVGFTGSAAAGISLFKRCNARDTPIPFYGELGSVNPVIVMPGAIAESTLTWASEWAKSLTMGVGQFCTNPGLVFLPQGPEGDQFLSDAVKQITDLPLHPMLTPSIAQHYVARTEQLKSSGANVVLPNSADGGAMLVEVDVDTFLANPTLQHEVFGPAAVVVRYSDAEQVKTALKALEGQLTCTLLLEESDQQGAQTLLPTLERKAGRLLVNGFPTGVEVCDAMIHGGPWPASTNFGHSSVGSSSIRRWLRGVCYQNFPETLLPKV